MGVKDQTKESVSMLEEAMEEIKSLDAKNLNVFKNMLERFKERTVIKLKNQVSEKESSRFELSKFRPSQAIDGIDFTERDLILEMGEFYLDQLGVLKNEIIKNPEHILSLNITPKIVRCPHKIFNSAFLLYQNPVQIGEGGNGVVFSCNTEDGQKFAIKVLDSKKATTEKKKRFKNEFRFSSRNSHPNIITVLDHGLAEDGSPFYVMPLYESSLRKLIGGVKSSEVLPLVSQILDGVEAAHKMGVIHRDIKPENILISSKGFAVVADFGIAEFGEDDFYTSIETKDGTRIGNANYAAPELRVKNNQVDHRCDIFSLGLILNELFTGSVPHGEDYKKIENVSSDYKFLDPIVSKMIKQAPSARYNSIEEIKIDIAAYNRDYINFQKLSQSKMEIVPELQIDDPIITNPMRIITASWKDNTLKLTLNHEINKTWIWAFNNMGGHSSLYRKGPEQFQFKSNDAHITCEDNEVQPIIDYFKGWLPQVHAQYESKLKRDLEEAIEKRYNEQCRIKA